MRGKILCAVTGCTRGIFRETALKRWGTTRVWVICSVHWKRLTKAERRVAARINRLKVRLGIEHLGDREARVARSLIRRAGQ